MQVIKPMALGLCTRPIEFKRRLGLSVTASLYFPFRPAGQGTAWLEKRTAVLDRVVGLFSEAASEGEVRGIDPRLAAELFLGMVRAANVYRSEADSPDVLGRRVVEILLHGISGERP